MKQLDLFVWADAKPSNVIDAMPALIHKAAMETIYQIPRPKGEGKVIALGRAA
ncbi:hypothetical protein I7G59_04700 [Sinorhizobium meliloti]|uniref:hypothetical protein n=1 Tax=Rhizobium meliloti TaxID=382 RepID=UPI002380811F|nr:hypothetical protein [Sinorhizobium meliloti]MDE3796627.1 hypothetical protein [Sinorhizobium meliloti]